MVVTAHCWLLRWLHHIFHLCLREPSDAPKWAHTQSCDLHLDKCNHRHRLCRPRLLVSQVALYLSLLHLLITDSPSSILGTSLSLHLITPHCKLGEIFLLKTLKHKKSRKSSLTFGIYSSIFIGNSVAICGR